MITNLIATNTDKSELVSRDLEVSIIIETLMRIDKPNIILTGEPGVGKTAIVNHLAYLIGNNLVPEELKGYSLAEINLSDLIAGEGYRGVFEKKCQDLINQATAKGKTILFMDEFHIAENLGKMANGQTPGFGNTLKPYLTRGDVRIIGATTNDEYNGITDRALLRRFRRVIITEPTEEACLEIIKRHMVKYNTRKTNVSVDNFEKEVYSLSVKISGANPDKATDIVDLIFAKCRVRDLENLDNTTFKEFLKEIFESKKYLGNVL